ncbi:tellurium resistance protein [Paracoccus sp. TOH]|uniref:TDT family transporter n=1 Tax=Paracoccus sp. TOH TaxID=1263728 RepID=UPI0025AF7F1F|nr:tellurium resistance protein [Paracoccus sp. TOH]WJS83569.1 tellurium resistance protein [Paracoccus sp. TOH]
MPFTPPRAPLPRPMMPRPVLPRPVMARPRPPGLWRSVPPAIFPPLLGALGLALAWQAALPLGLAPAVPGLMAGMAIAAWGFAMLAYGSKLLHRPAVLAEELRILPGRAGIAAAVVGIYAAAHLLSPFAPALARVVLATGMAAQLVLWVVAIPVMTRLPGQGRVTPVWQLTFVGPIVAAQAAAGLGWTALAQGLWWPMAATAGLVWLLSLRQALAERVPAPLRPLLMIHLAPVAMLGHVAAALGWPRVALGLAFVAAAVLGLAVLRGRWLTEAGFSPLWGAFTFPLAATAGLWSAVAGFAPGWALPALILLVMASLVVLWILFRIWRAWAAGGLAAKTNAAVA